ncbi:MAG: helix-turn-helix domain-containing protein [Clostridia bacterium]|nr:helix-turn-helix domain-containing protein [Clostridia bacterium]
MRVIDRRATEELCIKNIRVMCAKRPYGKGGARQDAGRPSHGLLYVREGCAHFYHDINPTVSVEAGKILYIPKGYKYRMQYTAPMTEFVLLNFDLTTATDEEVVLAEKVTVMNVDDNTQQIERIMLELESTASSLDFFQLLHRKELVYRLFGVLYSAGTFVFLQTQRYPQIMPGVMLLEKTYLQNLPIAHFAEACNISLSSFRSLFSKQFGVSPVQYRNNLRIERAKQQLTEGIYSVNEIAYACGFENIGYFCRYYKKVVGEAPGATKKGTLTKK